MKSTKRQFYLNNSIVRLSLKSSPFTTNDMDLIKKSYELSGSTQIYEFAKFQKVEPFVAKLLMNQLIEKPFWAKVYKLFEKRNRKILTILNDIFRAFEKSSIDKIFLYENFGVLLATNGNIGCFASGDIDIYAEMSFKSEISKILSDFGFAPSYTFTSFDLVKVEYINNKLFSNGFRINVMWEPLARTKLPLPIEMNNCVKWDELITYRDTSIKIPKIDSLMYLCLLHASVHSYNRSPGIRLYTDIDRVVLLNPNWDAISKFAQHDKTIVRITTSALLSNKLLGTPIPKELFDNWIKTFKNINIILKLVYNEKSNNLRSNPNRFSIFLIEVLSSDSNWLKALLNILFPSKDWIRKNHFLNDNESLINGYFKHFSSLI